MAKKTLKCTKCDRTFSMPAHLARHVSTIHSAKAGKKTATRKPRVKRKGKVGRPKKTVARKKVRRPKVRATAKKRVGRPKLRAAAKKRVGRPKVRAAARKRARRPRARAAAVGLSLGGGAARLIADMRVYHSQLVAQRAALDAEIGGLADAMDAIGGAKAAPARRKKRVAKRVVRRGRPRRPVGRPAGGIRAGSLTDCVIKALRQRTRPMSPSDITKAVRKGGYKSRAKDLAKAVSNTLAKAKRVKRVGRGLYRL